MDEEKLQKGRLKELAQTAYHQNRYTFSRFLTPAELTVLSDMRQELQYMDFDTFGGNEFCERQIVRFGSERLFGYEEPFPIKALSVEPISSRFAEQLGHRDYLGALMNLGMTRDVIGDIFIRDQKAYIFCMDHIADYIVANLDKIKHTSVKVKLAEGGGEALLPRLRPVEVLVQTPRFDAVVAAVCKLSRSGAQQLFREKKVLLQGRVCENHSLILKENDVFSVRGFGKFLYEGCGNQTRKGKFYVHIKQYE